MPVTSLITAATSLKLAKEGLEALIGIRDFNAVAVKIAAVNEQLLKAQDGLFMHTARMAELQQELLTARAELTELKQKASDREKYELFPIREGAFVYRLRQVHEGDQVAPGSSEPMHYLCQGCLSVRGHMIVLQLRGDHLWCDECKATHYLGERSSWSGRANIFDG